MPPITPALVLTILLVAATAMLVGIALRGWLSRQPQSQVAVNFEAEAFKLVTEGLERLADTSGEDKMIAAATQRKATKKQLLQQAAAEIQAKAGGAS